MKYQIKKFRGFSLTELLIVVAILGLLGSIALPSYRDYVKEGSRAAAKSYLLEVASQQANFLQDNRFYTNLLSDLNITSSKEVTDNYEITLTTGSASAAPSFTITATPKGSMDGDVTLTLNHLGVKTPLESW